EHPAPRPEAAQHPARRPGRAVGLRLRHRQAGGRRPGADGPRLGAGHPAVHGPGAGGRAQRGGRPCRRRLGPGRRALRAGGRPARRHPAVAAAVVLLTVAGVVAAAVAPYFDPDRPFRETERKLARQEAVVLIGEKGPPVHSRWAAGYDGRTTSPAGGPFTVE